MKINSRCKNNEAPIGPDSQHCFVLSRKSAYCFKASFFGKGEGARGVAISSNPPDITPFSAVDANAPNPSDNKLCQFLDFLDNFDLPKGVLIV